MWVCLYAGLNAAGIQCQIYGLLNSVLQFFCVAIKTKSKMSQLIHIAIITSAVVLVGMAAIALNYSPAPAHAQLCKGWVFPGAHGQTCYPSKKECEQALIAAGSSGKCIRNK